ncbi:hypothetical protein ACE1BH_21450, partial [Aeromonas jandaei]
LTALTLRSQLPVFLLGYYGDAQTGTCCTGVEITQIERCRAALGAREEEWCLVQTGASLGHIRSLGLWLSLPGVVQSRVDADEVSGRHADATIGIFRFFLENQPTNP